MLALVNVLSEQGVAERRRELSRAQSPDSTNTEQRFRFTGENDEETLVTRSTLRSDTMDGQGSR